jgi:hypothetical protein
MCYCLSPSKEYMVMYYSSDLVLLSIEAASGEAAAFMHEAAAV